MAPPPFPIQTLDIKFESEIVIEELSVDVTKLMYKAPVLVYAPIIFSPLMIAYPAKSSILII